MPILRYAAVANESAAPTLRGAFSLAPKQTFFPYGSRAEQCGSGVLP